MSYEGPERRTVITFTREDADRLVRTEQKLDTLIASVSSSEEDTAKKHASNSSRIGKLERKLAWIIGIGTAAVFIIGLYVK